MFECYWFMILMDVELLLYIYIYREREREKRECVFKNGLKWFKSQQLHRTGSSCFSVFCLLVGCTMCS